MIDQDVVLYVAESHASGEGGGGEGGGGEGAKPGGKGGGAGGGGTICGVQTSPPLSCIHVQPSLQRLAAFVAV